MKKIMSIFVLMALTISGSSCTSQNLRVTDLPAAVVEQVTTNFNMPVRSITQDIDNGVTEYEIKFQGGAEADFYADGTFKEVKCPGGEVPAAFIPEAVRNYVTENYPGTTIVKIENENRRGYDVTLSNRTELEFDAQGTFLGIDR